MNYKRNNWGYNAIDHTRETIMVSIVDPSDKSLWEIVPINYKWKEEKKND
jgi:hypothetical protein